MQSTSVNQELNMQDQEFNKYLFTKSKDCSDVRGRLCGQQLPAWVQGVLLYNSPCEGFPKDSGSLPNQHWMDGLSMMSSFKIQEKGKTVSFTKKALRSEECIRQNETKFSSQQENPGNQVLVVYGSPNSRREGALSKYTSTSLENLLMDEEVKDNCNSSFYNFGRLVMATNETPCDRIIDPDSLDTGNLIDMSYLLNMKAARPLKDHNGDFYILSASLVTGNKYHFIKFKRPSSQVNYSQDTFPSETEFVATIPSGFPNHISYFHSFGMTDNYLIFCEQPMAYNVNKIKRNKTERKSTRDCLEWIPNERNNFHVVDKRSGRSFDIKYTTDRSYFFFNFVNCYESREHIIVDLITYDGPEVMDSMLVEKLNSGGFHDRKFNSKIMRFVLPLNCMEQGIDLNFGQWNEATAVRRNDNVTLRPTILTRETGMENPKVNDCFSYRRYTYTYVVGWINGLNPKNLYSNAITKVDVDSGITSSWKTEESYEHPSEIVFVPNPAASTEDDGVLISCVSNSRDNLQSYLVFIDARSMLEISKVYFDEPIPFGFHTHFIHRFA